MNKAKTPGVSVLFYILGIVFLVIAAFMVATAFSYIKLYLASYGATFADMWSNSVQYIITQTVPYCGIGVVCLGIGKAIKESRASRVAVAAQAEAPAAEVKPEEPVTKAEEHEPATEAASEVSTADNDKTSEIASGVSSLNASQRKIEEALNYLADNIDATRDVISIKIEEKEKRDTYRLKEMGKGLTAAFETLERKTSEPVVIDVPVATGVVSNAIASAETTEAVSDRIAQADEPKGKVPPIFRVADTMAMPDVYKPNNVKSDVNRRSEEMAKKVKVAELFRVADTMAMPAIPRKAKTPELFRVADTMAMPNIPR